MKFMSIGKKGVFGVFERGENMRLKFEWIPSHSTRYTLGIKCDYQKLCFDILLPFDENILQTSGIYGNSR